MTARDLGPAGKSSRALSAIRTARPPVGGRWLLGFYFLNSTAESMQGVALLWTTYVLTHNDLAVGAINAAAYLPGVVLGLLLRKKSDSSSAAGILSVTNWVLFTGSSLLAVVWAAGFGAGPILTSFVIVQCSLSVIKMFNKASVSRLVRQRFPMSQAVPLLEKTTSLTVIGVMVGGGVSGVLLDSTTADVCFAIAALCYLLSLAAVRLVIRAPAPEPRDRAPEHQPGQEQDQPPRGEQRHDAAESARGLRLVLVYSVPSSGALLFITTLLVPLAQAVAPRSGVFYSVLVVMVSCGGFLAGTLLSRGKIQPSWVLGSSLVVSGLLLACFSAVRWLPAVVLLMLVISVVLTAHAILMQVLTNQAPPEDKVGQFSMVRNAVAGSAKAGFSLAAGLLVDATGLGTTWLILAAVLTVFGIAWWYLPGRSAIGRMVHVP
jgi:hypothetical protein